MTKNVFCFAGAIFSGRYFDQYALFIDFLTFLAFCAASSSVYILNDVLDRERDAQHPKKRFRPIPSGQVSLPGACVLGFVLFAASCSLGYYLKWGVLICMLLYAFNNIVYSIELKHRALLDVISIATGFVLRLLAGVYAIDEMPTTWITLCTFFLTVFIGFCKRRAELEGLIPEVEEPGVVKQQSQRPVLSQYTIQLLDSLINSSAVMAVVCYASFTTNPNKNPSLVVTVPLVFYSIMYYKRLVVMLKLGEEPERIVLKDRSLQICVILWAIGYFGILHYDLHLFR